MIAWTILNSRRRPASPDRILLCELLEIYCWHQWDQQPADIVEIALGTADEDANERESLSSTISFLANVILDGRIATFARPIGGGPCDPLPLSRWEVDDFEPRFATSALCLDRWWDPAAEPTHWIFVDSGDVDDFMDEWLGKNPDAEGEEADTRATVERGAADYRIVRLSEVVALTGLSRSTIYAKMAAGNFPQRVALGARMTGWYEDEVKSWVKALR